MQFSTMFYQLNICNEFLVRVLSRFISLHLQEGAKKAPNWGHLGVLLHLYSVITLNRNVTAKGLSL